MFSTAEITSSPTKAIGTLWKDAAQALSEMTAFKKFAIYFWFAGPFILLIERSPADAWVIIIDLLFIIHCIRAKQTDFFAVSWVRFGLLFLSMAGLAGLLSSMPQTALAEALLWARFPLFAIASAFWLGRDIRVLKMMFALTGIAVMVMCAISTTELFLVGQIGGRLSWPYGDLVPGNYIAKVGLPIFVLAMTIVNTPHHPHKIWFVLFLLFGVFGVFITGERVNFILVVCAILMTLIVYRPNIKMIGVLSMALAGQLVVTYFFFPKVWWRYVTHFLENIPTGPHSKYFNTMAPGIISFLENPSFGIGTGNYRHLCADYIAHNPVLECHPHPHNFYIQMASETGIIGLVFGILFVCALVYYCFKAARLKADTIIIVTCFVAPFGLLWPIKSNADFFGQWNNIFMWSAIALSLACAQVAHDKNRQECKDKL